MNYESNKAYVLDLFDNHIMRYIIKDLEILNNVEPDGSGDGGCAIPLASSTFAATDLIGYLIHPDNRNTVEMSFTDFLNNEKYFPEFKQYSSRTNFLDSFRDNLRSMMIHRFSLAKFNITKQDTGHLFVKDNGCPTFSASHFSKITITAIKKIYNEIREDTFIIDGYTKEMTMEIIKERIERLKDFEGKVFVSLNDLPTLTTTPQTTKALG